MSSEPSSENSNVVYYPNSIYPGSFEASVNRIPPAAPYVPGQPRPIRVEYHERLSEPERKKLFLKTGRFFPRYMIRSRLPALSESEEGSNIDKYIDVNLVAEEYKPEILAYREQKKAKQTLKAQRERQYKVLRNAEQMIRMKEYQQMRRAARKTYRGQVRAEKAARVARAAMEAEEQQMRAVAPPVNRRTLRRKWMAVAAGAPVVKPNRRTKRGNWWRAAGVAAGLEPAPAVNFYPEPLPAAARARKPATASELRQAEKRQAELNAWMAAAPAPSRRKKAAAPGRKVSNAEKRMLARVPPKNTGAFAAAQKAAAGGGGGLPLRRNIYVVAEEDEE
jgi:hypothetical protein